MCGKPLRFELKITHFRSGVRYAWGWVFCPPVGELFDSHTSAVLPVRVEPMTTLKAPCQSSHENKRPQRLTPT